MLPCGSGVFVAWWSRKAESRVCGKSFPALSPITATAEVSAPAGSTGRAAPLRGVRVESGAAGRHAEVRSGIRPAVRSGIRSVIRLSGIPVSLLPAQVVRRGGVSVGSPDSLAHKPVNTSGRPGGRLVLAAHTLPTYGTRPPPLPVRVPPLLPGSALFLLSRHLSLLSRPAFVPAFLGDAFGFRGGFA